MLDQAQRTERLFFQPCYLPPGGAGGGGAETCLNFRLKYYYKTGPDIILRISCYFSAFPRKLMMILSNSSVLIMSYHTCTA